MAELTLYLYDDEVARAWQPFALTRPIGELLLGAHTFRARAELLFGARCAGHITADHLLGFDEPYAAPVVAHGDIRTDRARLFLSSRAVFDWDVRIDWPERAMDLAIGADVVGRFVPAGAPTPDASWFAGAAHTHAPAPALQVDGHVLEHAWDLIAENGAQIVRDYERNRASDAEPAAPRFDAIGYTAGALRIGDNVTIEPNVVFDFSHGPIWLDDNVTVRAFTRLTGPSYVGPRSTLLGGPYDVISVGPVCRVHGEIEESVVLGYSNKAHDGFLGHAYLGRWVNLGAMTTNSDLKNNYGTIRMWTTAGDVDTGLIKLGSLLGDHVKTGIGALLNTGTVIGAGSNLYGTDMPPKYVPPFSWGSGSQLVAYDVEKFLQVAMTVMKRRDVVLSEDMTRVLRAAWQLARAQS
jgi:UDP-N-acetylglucosamine diphosphorylase / glucose-1-phosphate thymidylyltransferase / UDP-N-acetylgalactosamine diphosphorylase / glucosamine-1-phosphate N-acetyltransferase / galactosamine-1-phosphate N-acetyltransferase